MHFAKSKLLNVAAFKHSLDLGSSDQLPIKPFKSTIKNALSQLKSNQNQGISAAELVSKYTWLIDQLVIIAWEHYLQQFGQSIDAELVGVGGYGRGELHPHSDVDLLILLKKDNYEQAKELIENFIRFMWDIGLDIGHSVRSCKDCISEARANFLSKKNVMLNIKALLIR